MAQHDYLIAGGAGVGGAAVRVDIQDALQAGQSLNKGSSAPATKYTGMLWVDDSGTPWIVKQWDGADWIRWGTVNASTNEFTPSGGTTNYTLASGYANKLRNGTFLSWVNGASGTIAAAATGAAAIAASGWAVLATGASVTWAQVTSGYNGAPQSLKVTGASSVTDVVIAQRIEAGDAAALAGKTCTFQVAVYNNTGGSITPTLATRYAGSANNWSSPVADLAATNLQACPNASWTIVSYTLAVHANAVNGYEIKLDFGNNFSTTGKYVQIAAADLRVATGVTTGLNAAPPAPELPDAAATLARCARYHQSTWDNATAPGTATHNGMVGAAFVINGTVTNAAISFPVRMWTAPTLAYWDGNGNASKVSYGGGSWTDNGSPAGGSNVSFAVGQTGFVAYFASGTPNGQVFLHYTAYADFW